MISRLFALATAVCLASTLLFISLSPTAIATSQTVVIDAVLYDGYETGDSDEAVRLRNISELPVDIAGWRLNDGESATAVIPFTTTLAPNQTIWLAKDGLAFYKQFGFPPNFQRNPTWPDVPQLDGLWPNLANSGDQVLLLDSDGIVVDCVAYENNNGEDCGIHWQGAPIAPYRPSTAFGAEGQLLYRQRDPETGWLFPDTNTAVDWAQHTADPVHGRKVQYPGWDLDSFFWTAQLTETAVLTIAIAPDNAYETVAQQIRSAQTSLYIESHTIENLAITQDLVDALGRGVSVTLLLEGGPPGGVSDQERYICQQIEAANGRCWFMINSSDHNIYDRYTYIHAKFILIDGVRVIISSENLSPRSLAYDDKSDGSWGRRGVLLVTDAPGVVSHVQSIFAHDFDPTHHADITGTQAIGAPPPGFVPITQTGGTTYTVRHPTPFVVEGTFAFELVQSPENSLRPSDGLLGLLNRAGTGDTILFQQLDERPYWGSSNSNPTDDPNLRLEAAIEAARRGAQVRLLLDSYFDTGGTTSNSATCAYVNNIAKEQSLDMVCQLGNPTGEGIHNKMVLTQIDGRGTIHIGSINGTELSSKGNRELALQVQSDAAYTYLAKMFWQDWGYVIYLPILPNRYFPPARHLLISEILYDPPGATDDSEFIELVNPTSQPVDISHFSIGDAVFPTDYEDVRRFPANTILGPGQTLVIAVAGTAFRSQFGFNPDFELLDTDPLIPDLIDDPAWGDPSTFLRLGNSGDEVILRDATDQVIDAVAYGNGSFAGVVSCPLVSAPNFSLERYPYWQDSNDCSLDFREWGFPNPGALP